MICVIFGLRICPWEIWTKFKLILVIRGYGISWNCLLRLRWMSLDLTQDKSTLVQVRAWCRQAECSSHYLANWKAQYSVAIWIPKLSVFSTTVNRFPYRHAIMSQYRASIDPVLPAQYWPWGTSTWPLPFRFWHSMFTSIYRGDDWTDDCDKSETDCDPILVHYGTFLRVMIKLNITTCRLMMLGITWRDMA